METYDKSAGVLTLDSIPYYQVIATIAADKSDIHLKGDGGETNAVTLTDKEELGSVGMFR